MKFPYLLFGFITMGVLLTGCDKTSTESETDLEISSVVAEQAVVGWEINEAVNSANEIWELTQTSKLIEESELDEIPGATDLKNQLNRMYGEIQLLFGSAALRKTTGDSLIYQTIIDRGSWGFSAKKSLYFDAETGRLRYVEVHYDFPENHNLEYDSSQVILFVGENWLFPSQSQIVELYRLQTFREDFMVQSIESRITATDYDGNRITGVEIMVDSYYHPDRPLVHVNKYILLNADQSGTLRITYQFNDSSTFLNEVMFNNDGTGTFTKERRDGTHITGSFDSVEDDLHGSFSETIDFPAGRYVDRLERLAVVSIMLPDSIFSAAYKETIFFDSGEIDSAAVAVQVQQVMGRRTTTLSRLKPNGAHGTFVIEEQDGESLLTGFWITWNGYYTDVRAEYYFDGTAHLHYEVYTSEDAFMAEEDAIIVVDYYFSPDQSGTGTLVHNGQTYNVKFDASGSAEVTLGEKSHRIKVY